MSQVGTILKSSRTDVRLSGTQQGVGGKPANVLFIYTGEVGCKFVSPDNTTVRDQLVIVLPDAALGLGQIVHPPIPIILPTSWNANDDFSVIAVNNPTLGLQAGQFTGLSLTADIAVQNGALLNVQYQLSITAVV
jgi:hypothetical protein